MLDPVHPRFSSEQDSFHDEDGIPHPGSGFAIVGLCATIIGCFVGTGGAMLAVGAVAATNGNVMQDREDLECHSRQADYFYCMLQGHADATCRQEAGIPSAPNGGSCE